MIHARLKNARAALAVFAASLGMSGVAGAADIVDQSNRRLAIAPPIANHAIGGSSRQQLAQTFTVGLSGRMTKIRLPLGCESGTLILEIGEQSPVGEPGGRVLRRTEIPATSLPSVIPEPADFIDITLVAPVMVAAGDRLALTLRNETGECAVARAEAGQTYDRGDGYFLGLPDTPAWALLNLGGLIASDPTDLPFETVLDDGSAGGASGGCTIAGLGGIGDAPVCRCLRDAGLREFRCALLHPDFFAIRRVPWPLPPGRAYLETWEVLPLTALQSAVRVTLSGENISKPVALSFAGKSRKNVESRSATLRAPAAPKAVAGEAILTYGQSRWRMDTSIPEEQFGPPPSVAKPLK